MTQSTAFPTGTILGYPRIGPRRELKKALEAFWAGKASADEVETTAAALRKRTRDRLAELGLSPDELRRQRAERFYAIGRSLG